MPFFGLSLAVLYNSARHNPSLSEGSGLLLSSRISYLGKNRCLSMVTLYYLEVDKRNYIEANVHNIFCYIVILTISVKKGQPLNFGCINHIKC